jgi:uncharacterized protein YecT (DUF1311 family)
MMMTIPRIAQAAVVVLCLGVSQSMAEQALDCGNPIDQFTINQCATQSYDRADHELNSQYQEIMRRLKDDPETAKLLTTAQRAWVTFRDAECELQSSSVEGGTMRPMVFSNCLEKLTKQRLVDFEPYLDCSRGGVDCPATKVKPLFQIRPTTKRSDKAP